MSELEGIPCFPIQKLYTMSYWLLHSFVLNATIALLLALYRYVLHARRPKPSKPEPNPPQKTPVAISLRFRNIPSEYDEAMFRSAVGGGKSEAIVGLSWTLSAVTESTHTATACFGSRPSFFSHVLKPAGLDTNVTLEFASENVEVSIDDYFHGMTPLYWPKNPPDVEYVQRTTAAITTSS